MTLPPIVSGGYPVVGHIFEMLRDRAGLFKRGYAEHGDLFAIKLGPQYVLVVTGSEHNRLMYTQTDKTLNMQEGYTFLEEAVGKVLFTASKDDYYNQRPVLQEVFKRERMVGYIQAMNIEVQRWLDSLGESGEMDLSEEMLHLTQYVAGRALIGPNFREELGEGFWDLYTMISKSLDPVLPPTLPLPKFKRRDQAREKIHAVLRRLIDQRRDHPDQYDDLISTLLKTPLKDGTFMPDETIVAMFMGLIFAGHETTAGQAGWLIALLLQHPDYLDAVKAEIQAQVAYGHEIDASVLSQLKHIYWAIDETTRLHPSADTQIRTLEAPMTVGSYDVPAGWRMMVSGSTSHFLPDTFQQPERFDPYRFSPERGEGKDPFAIVGFGGGIHKCTGMNFAKNEMAIITSLLFQQFDVELLSEEVHTVTGNGANRPSAVRVRYQRKPLTALTDADTIREAADAGCPHIRQHLATHPE
ncbi:MAG: cytochrome P450 [Anaerolineae bacterium]|nr:cytochrome P450 [Anaerolineae bacterium]